MAVAKSYYDGSWNKEVRHALIDLDMGVNDLAHEIGRTRVHVSQVINSRCYSVPTIKAICNVLDIDDPDTMDKQAELEAQEQPEPEADDLYAAFEAAANTEPILISNAMYGTLSGPDTMDKQAAQETPEPEHDDLYAAFEAMLAKQTEGETV